MKVAFDVKGTLEGPKGELVRKLLDGFLAKDAKVTVWSNAYSYATEHVMKNGLDGKVTPELKYGKGDVLEGYEQKTVGYEKMKTGQFEKRVVGYEMVDGVEDKSKPIQEDDPAKPVLKDDLSRPLKADDRTKPIYSDSIKDLAIEDDRSQMWLGAKRLVFVDELTEEMVEELLK